MSEISIRQVDKRYGKTQVVHALDLEIRSREFVVILGPSGCGKSTLLRMIAGLEGISGGEIAIDGEVVNDLEPRERGCAMVFQNYALYPHVSVADNIGYSLKVAGVPAADRRRQIEEIAQVVELDQYLDRRPANLSGGQRQRVAMARAMIKKPKVFLFDEPLSNLDALLRVQMRAEIRKLHRQIGATSVFVTHDQAEAMTLGDRLIVMRAGRIEQVGTPQEVYRRPATRFVAGFVGSPPMNLIPGRFDRDGAFVPGGWPASQPLLTAASPPGGDVLLGIRPESLRLTPATGQPAADAIVDFVEEFGASRVYHLDWSGLRIAAASTAIEEYPTGARLRPTFERADLHLFSSESGERLDLGPARAQ